MWLTVIPWVNKRWRWNLAWIRSLGIGGIPYLQVINLTFLYISQNNIWGREGFNHIATFHRERSWFPQLQAELPRAGCSCPPSAEYSQGSLICRVLVWGRSCRQHLNLAFLTLPWSPWAVVTTGLNRPILLMASWVCRSFYHLGKYINIFLYGLYFFCLVKETSLP